jgi:hypothetical protein
MPTKKPNLNILKTLLWSENGLKQHETELLHLLLEKQIAHSTHNRNPLQTKYQTLLSRF